MTMKKGKLIGIGVASLGVVLSVGGALALYTKNATDVGFSFGKYNYTPVSGDINYYLGTEVSEEDVVGASTITKVVKVPMSATYPNDLETQVIAQDYRAGNISVSFSGGAVFEDKVSVSAAVKGYAVGSYLSGGVTVINNETFTDASEGVSGAADVTVKAGDTTPTIAELCQYLEVTLTFTGTYLDFDEASFGLTVKWDKVSNEYSPAYIKGDLNNWTEAEEYRMVENIDATQKEWVFKDLTGFEAMKIYRKVGENETWVGPSTVNTSLNVTPDKTETYKVVWHESETTVNTNVQETVNYISHVEEDLTLHVYLAKKDSDENLEWWNDAEHVTYARCWNGSNDDVTWFTVNFVEYSNVQHTQGKYRVNIGSIVYDHVLLVRADKTELPNPPTVGWPSSGLANKSTDGDLHEHPTHEAFDGTYFANVTAADL